MTEQDRWWLAYCLLGAALVVRAPDIYWAIVVVLVWGVLLTVVSLRVVRDLVNGRPNKEDAVNDKNELWVTRWQEKVRKGRASVLTDNTVRLEKITEHAPPNHWPHRPLVPRATAEEVTERLGIVVDDAAPPAAVTKTDLPPVMPDGAATSEVLGSGRVLVNLTGTVWTTETMLLTILDAIGKARGRGENEV